MKWLLKFIERRFNTCIHPSFAIEVFHFSHKGSDLTCGYLCTICMGKVDIPLCKTNGVCARSGVSDHWLDHFRNNPKHVPIIFSAQFIDRFISCHSCGEEFLIDDSDLKTGYHVRNFTRSAEIKRHLISEGKEL